MTATSSDLILKTREYVQEYFQQQNYDPSHDFSHVERVVSLAKKIALSETEKSPDMLVVELAALLHDVGDFKYSDGVKTCREIIGAFLRSISCENDIAEKVIFIVENVSFRRELEQIKSGNTLIKSAELQIVQDADRLEAIGAIGIARCFSFGAVRGRPFYDSNCPHIDPEVLTKEQYDAQSKENKSVTLNHFHEKLFTLKKYMNTDMGKSIASYRDEFMHSFVDEFLKEWNEC